MYNTYLYSNTSAACKTGYTYKPKGTSFTFADFSLYVGMCASLGMVVRHPSIQHS